MKEILFAIILGIVQGLTEFLPISSSGHLAILQDIFGITSNNLFLTVMLHFGTLMAVVVYYFKDLKNLAKPQNFNKVWLLIIATLPSAIMGLLLEDFISTKFKNAYLCFGFLLTAIILFGGEKIYRKRTTIKDLNTKSAIIIGLSQCIALFPAVSRSGTTISFGMMSGVKKEESTNFSFLLSIPIILGSVVLECFKINAISVNWLGVMSGIIASFISGYFAIKLMVKLIKNKNLNIFCWYLLALSLLSFVNYYIIEIW